MTSTTQIFVLETLWLDIRGIECAFDTLCWHTPLPSRSWSIPWRCGPSQWRIKQVSKCFLANATVPTGLSVKPRVNWPYCRSYASMARLGTLARTRTSGRSPRVHAAGEAPVLRQALLLWYYDVFYYGKLSVWFLRIPGILDDLRVCVCKEAGRTTRWRRIARLLEVARGIFRIVWSHPGSSIPSGTSWLYFQYASRRGHCQSWEI